jgi:hypothetical protein
MATAYAAKRMSLRLGKQPAILFRILQRFADVFIRMHALAKASAIVGSMQYTQSRNAWAGIP